LPQYQYAAKYACGRAGGAPQNFAPGVYFTSINVHNFGKETGFLKRITVSLVDEKAGGGTKWIKTGLPAERSMQIDCGNILAHLKQEGVAWPPSQVVEGFVIIRTPVELDVVGVYSAFGAGNLVSTMEMERVPVRKVP
jgi:hypothetical protein